MNKMAIILLVLLTCSYANAQKKVLDHDSYDIWNSIEGNTISRDGKWISYYLEPVGGGDPELKLKDVKGAQILSVERGSAPVFTYDSKDLIIKITPPGEVLKDLQRSKVKKEKLPKDTLAIYNLKSGELKKIPGVKSYKIPEKWDGWMAYLLEPDLPAEDKKDSTDSTSKVSKKKKAKKEDKDNGYRLVLRNLETSKQDTFRYVLDYKFAREGKGFSFVTTGVDSIQQAGVYAFDFESGSVIPVFRSKAKYHQVTWSDAGNQLVFIADLDTTKIQYRPYNLHYWIPGADTAASIAYSGNGMPDNWNLRPESSLVFSKDGSRLYFESGPNPLLKDTTLLDEEIVNVEVWSYTDGRLHTQQKIEKEEDLKKGYTTLFYPSNKSIVQLGQINIPTVRFEREVNSPWVLGLNDIPYQQFISWEGGPSYNDLFIIDTQSGKAEKVAEKIRGSISLSPGTKYACWYDRIDSAWFTYSISQKKIFQVTTNDQVTYYDELNDSPDYPSPYGLMAWTQDDQKLLIYDRYDIWEIDPENKTSPVNITQNGRTLKRSYRYIKLDDEERFIRSKQELMLSVFNESDKSEGIYSFTYGKTGTKELTKGNYHYSNVRKAQAANQLIFSKESFEVFPDILSSDLSLKTVNRISDANPQQKEYNWGTAEIYNWTSLNGEKLQGLLIKPENFDPGKKYPMIVNFYERSSDGLNRHRSPYPHRSTINYSFYTSRGYVIFNPDVVYRIGYPGESAFNCVIPGVTSLIEEGFIDENNIGAQGHSWGGYQVAYLVTKTDIFKAVEAGAPVPNMISAYGGIRWWTGLSRMFQYEHTQSRIGGSLWEYPLRYIENSPIFFVDKINTPVLIMHNDADGHVPWYQGIEFFVALRRLGKPSWMLNYQGEPHWPLKMQNQKDFVVRMQQYFDHYLKGAPIPDWMENGVPATDVGVDQHLLPADQ